MKWDNTVFDEYYRPVAWESPIGRAVIVDNQDSQTQVFGVLLHLPTQSLAWDHYQLSVIHLKDLPDVESAVKDYPEAEYEIMLVALLSAKCPNYYDQETRVPITPINFKHQFHGIDEHQIERLVVVLTKAMLASRLIANPDFEYMKTSWSNTITDAMQIVKGGVQMPQFRDLEDTP